MSPTRAHREAPRGFVVIVVLMLLAIMAAVVATQLRVIEGQEVMGIRAEEEVKARAVAEGCLSLMQAYVDRFANKNRSATGAATANSPPDYFLVTGGPVDFDRLLDPDLSANNSNNYQPTFGSSVMVPNNTPGGGELGAKHRWKLLRRDGGACLMRFEDNSDEFLLASTLATGTTQTADEIAAASVSFRDVPYRDRDRAIYLVALGVYPATGTDAEVYARAHARVTLRRLFAAPVPGVPVSGVFAGTSFESKNGATVCGVGGVQAGVLDFKNTSCMCGNIETVASIGKTPLTTGCGSPCGTCASGTVATVPGLTPARYDINGDLLCGPPPATSGPGCDPLVPPVGPGMAIGPVGPPLPPVAYYRWNEGLGAPNSSNNIGDARTCNFYGTTTGQIFVWDRRDTDTQASIAALIGGPSVPPIPIVDCSTQSSAPNVPIPQPCTWVPGAPGSVVCAPTQSPCWKLIADLGTAGVDADISVSAPAVPEQSVVVSATSDRWIVPSGPIPNVSGTRRFGVPSTPDPLNEYLCGNDLASPSLAGVPSCTNCAAGTAAPLRFERNAAVLDQWTFDAATNENLPVPAVFILDGLLTRRTNLSNLGTGSTRPVRLTVLTNQVLRIGTSTYSQCCATCDCSGYTSLQPTCGTESGVPTGFAAKADQDCLLQDNPRITGSVRCGDAVNLVNDTCMTGDIAAYGGDSCPATSCSSSVGVCFQNNARIDGTIYSLNDVCGRNNAIVNGGIYSERDVRFENDFTLNGQLYANRNIELEANAVITFDGSGASLGNPGLTTFMEAAW